MPEFDSWNQYQEFSYFVGRTSRHILDAKNRRFLDAVLETSRKRKGSIEKGAVLWRAQLGHVLRNEIVRDDDGQEVDWFEAEVPFLRRITHA